MATTTTTDDDSPDVQYSGEWRKVTADPYYLGTSHGTSESGATATFTWIGGDITVYGGIAQGSGNAKWEYIVDGGKYKTVEGESTIPMVLPANSHGQELHQTMASTSKLLMGEHTIVIRNTGTIEIFLDQFSYQPPPRATSNLNPAPTQHQLPAAPPTTKQDAAPSGTRIQGSTPSSVTSSAGTKNTQNAANSNTINSLDGAIVNPSTSLLNNTGVVQPFATSTSFSTTIYTTTDASGETQVFTVAAPVVTTAASPENDKADSQNHGLPTGAVVGVVIGVLTILVVLLILTICLRRRRRGRVASSNDTRGLLADGKEKFTGFPQRQMQRNTTVTPFDTVLAQPGATGLAIGEVSLTDGSGAHLSIDVASNEEGTRYSQTADTDALSSRRSGNGRASHSASQSKRLSIMKSSAAFSSGTHGYDTLSETNSQAGTLHTLAHNVDFVWPSEDSPPAYTQH